MLRYVKRYNHTKRWSRVKNHKNHAQFTSASPLNVAVPAGGVFLLFCRYFQNIQCWRNRFSCLKCGEPQLKTSSIFACANTSTPWWSSSEKPPHWAGMSETGRYRKPGDHGWFEPSGMIVPCRDVLGVTCSGGTNARLRLARLRLALVRMSAVSKSRLTSA